MGHFRDLYLPRTYQKSLPDKQIEKNQNELTIDSLVRLDIIERIKIPCAKVLRILGSTRMQGKGCAEQLAKECRREESNDTDLNSNHVALLER
jgi:hypothetical protein